jgi:putative transposase
MEFSAELVHKICQEQDILYGQLTIHADNGGAMKGATILATLHKLGIIPSFSRPRVSDDNPFSESLFKTLKYCPAYPRDCFSSMEKAQEWVDTFVNWYNEVHLHSGIKFVSPSSRHAGKDRAILTMRKKVYEEAKKKNPLRWTGKTRDWEYVTRVYLNHLQGKEHNAMKSVS